MDAPDDSPLVVVDASIVLSWLLPDETPINKNNQLLLDHRTGKIKLAAPELIRFEVANGLLAAVLSRRIDITTAGKILEDFENLLFTFRIVWVDSRLILGNAFDLKISVYDAAYIVLATTLKARFYTLDHKLKAKIDRSVSLGEFS